MTSTYTSNKVIEQPGNGDYADTWNVPVNANWGYIDTALGGSALLNVTGVSGNITLTTSQYRPLSIIISGTPTGAITFYVPSGVGGQWTVTNSTAGTYTIAFASAAGGSAVVAAAGYSTIISCDGSASGMRLSNSVPSTAAGLNTYVQVNAGGYLGAYSNFSYDGTTLLVPNVTASGNVAGTWNGTAISAVKGGTGQTTYTTGDILYASSASALSKLAAGANGYVLTMAGGVPTWASGAGGSGTVNSGTAGQLAWYSATGTAVDGNAQASMSSGTLSLGTVGATLGAVALAGSTAGAITVRPPANTTTWTMTLPTTTGLANQVLQTDGTGATSWVSTTSGGTVTSVALGAGSTGLTINGLTSPPAITISGTYTLGGVLNVLNGGTGVTTSTGSGNNVLSTAPTLLNAVLTSPSMSSAVLGTPSSGTLTNCTGLPLGTGITGTLAVGNGGTGVTTSTGSGSVVLSTSPTLVTPLLGTPTSGTLTNCTGLPLSTGVTGTLNLSTQTSGTISLSTQVSGTLGVSNGGTGTNTALTTGSVVFAGASGVYSSSSNLFWDNTNARLGIGTNTPSYALTVSKSLASNYVANIVNSSTGSGSGALSVSSQTGFAIDCNTNSTAAGVYSLAGTNLASGGGSGAVGVSSGSGSWAFRSLSGGYGPFTGAHDGFILKTAAPTPGDLLVDGVVVGKKLSDVITEVSVSTVPNQSVIGIFVQTYPTDISNVPPALMQPDGSPDPAWYVYAPTHNLAVINGLGEGCLNVVGEGGNIQKGDLLVTSSTPGKAMKQADDIIRGYTVARAREDAVFAPGEEKQIACIYLCG